MAEGSDDIQALIAQFARLPGLGPRSARRVVLALIRRRTGQMAQLAALMASVAEHSRECARCGNIGEAELCAICADPARANGELCVVEDVADLWALERGRAYRGRYHVLGGTLSALDGRGPDALNIATLLERVRERPGVEVVLALSATVEGQATAHYLTERLGGAVHVTRLGHGVPVGGELGYLDEGTLAAAFKSRRPL